MKIEELNELDLSYTPPLSIPWDPVQIGAQFWTRASPNTFLLLFASRLISGHRECTGLTWGGSKPPRWAATRRQGVLNRDVAGRSVRLDRDRLMVMAGSLIEVYSSPLKRGIRALRFVNRQYKSNQDFEGERQENNRIFHLEKTLVEISVFLSQWTHFKSSTTKA